jgi:hypothetical protein
MVLLIRPIKKYHRHVHQSSLNRYRLTGQWPAAVNRVLPRVCLCVLLRVHGKCDAHYATEVEHIQIHNYYLCQTRGKCWLRSSRNHFIRLYFIIYSCFICQFVETLLFCFKSLMLNYIWFCFKVSFAFCFSGSFVLTFRVRVGFIDCLFFLILLFSRFVKINTALLYYF